VATEANLTVEEHVTAAVERVRVYWDEQRAIARKQLLSAEASSACTVSGPKSQESTASLRSHRAAPPAPQRDPAWAELPHHTGFTRGVRTDRAKIKKVFEAVKDT
jgi:hypothetical protein